STRKAGQKKRARGDWESTRNVREESRFLSSPAFLVLGLSLLYTLFHYGKLQLKKIGRGEGRPGRWKQTKCWRGGGSSPSPL
ncbi:MAG: hypothetical protein O7C56_06020, partial [Rickettsia endosymbiont of Ixodes persulcatus]|nr:hypothetical protein [Rickettsia endosymbiont of Ixodes persulcatus]